ncbi:MAG: CDP-alcohol phosphatidyltransferase, partial [Betaproteobacteria bacterium HGW-Betaproteobacteria-21]
LIAGQDLPQALIPAAALVYAAMAAILGWRWTSIRQSFGAANRVTLVRAALVAVVAGTVLFPQALQGSALPIAVLSTLALILDGVDGWVARRTGSASVFGARFDMELDAFFILVLCAMLVQLGKAGVWVLAIGAMRYLFVLAMHFLPWLSGTLPESFRRKLVCVVQVAALLLCLLPVVSPSLATAILALALAALTLSFAQDVRWLFLHAAGQAARHHRNQGVRS